MEDHDANQDDQGNHKPKFAVDKLSEVGDPIMEDENERTNSESNRLKIPSTKNTSSKKKKENHSHYGSKAS